MTKSQLAAARHHYRRFRAEHGEAFYRTAESAWNSARAHVHFMERLSADVAEHKRRSRAAKRGWKARRAAA